jgi:putative DNA primase/helicase
MDNMTTFHEAIRATLGYSPDSGILSPGKMIRFSTSDKPHDRSGFAKLFDDGEGGIFGCWRRGISETWQSRTAHSPEERTAYAEHIRKAREEAAQIESAIRAECRRTSAALWQQGQNVDAKHPYLLNKGVKPHGIKQKGDALMIPVRGCDGILRGLQFIGPDGAKRFKTGTEVTGGYHAFGKPQENTILICEGLVTGATLHEVTGHAVAVALNAGNLRHVAEALRDKNPEWRLIVCADDDHTTEGNPGLTKATEAAQVVNGLLAIPAFPDNRGPKDTDFNDFARLAGPEAVRACIEGASMPIPIPTPTKETTQQANHESPENPLDAAIQRLAALSPMQYDVVRKAKAKALGVRPGTLDAAVKEARKGSNTDDLPFTEVEPWPERVDPARLLTDIATTIRHFIVCCEEVSHAVALWIAMTWFIDVVRVAPLAVITSPEKRCGKSLLLSLLGRLVARAVTASNISPAALYRTIEAWQPTLLIDEADAFMKDNEELRGLLNSGHTRDSAYVIRTVGENFTPTKFSTWGAKAIAGIGHVADTLMDRAIIFELRRKLADEKVDRIRDAKQSLFDDLRSQLARFAEDYSEEVRQARPPLPDSLNDRAQDNWEPLLAIAMTASKEWLKLGTTAALKLSGGEIASQTIGTELLSDIQMIFKDKKVDRIATAELIEALCSDDEKPWKTYSKGFPITPRQLANRLKAYGIYSKTIRIGNDTAKGYEKDQFTEAFSRYIPPSPSASVTASQPTPAKDLRAFQSVTQADDVTVVNHWKPTPVKDCDVVTLETLPLFTINNLREVAL